MTNYFSCYSCNKVAAILDAKASPKCISCGSSNGEIVSRADFKERYERGVYYDIDLRTGGRAKSRKIRGKGSD